VNRWAPLTLAVLALVLGAGWAHAWKGRIRAEIETEQLREERDSTATENARLSGLTVEARTLAIRESARADSVTADASKRIAAAQRTEVQAEAVLAQAGASLDASLDTLRARVDSGLVVVVDSATTQVAREREGSRSIIDSWRIRSTAEGERATAFERALLASKGESEACARENESLKQRVIQEQQISEALTRQLHTPFFVGLWKDLLKYVVGAAVGALVLEVAR